MTDLECLMQIICSLGLTDVSERFGPHRNREFVTRHNLLDGTDTLVRVCDDEGFYMDFDFDPSGKCVDYCVW